MEAAALQQFSQLVVRKGVSIFLAWLFVIVPEKGSTLTHPKTSSLQLLEKRP